MYLFLLVGVKIAGRFSAIVIDWFGVPQQGSRAAGQQGSRAAGQT